MEKPPWFWPTFFQFIQYLGRCDFWRNQKQKNKKIIFGKIGVYLGGSWKKIPWFGGEICQLMNISRGSIFYGIKNWKKKNMIWNIGIFIGALNGKTAFKWRTFFNFAQNFGHDGAHVLKGETKKKNQNIIFGGI